MNTGKKTEISIKRMKVFFVFQTNYFLNFDNEQKLSWLYA